VHLSLSDLVTCPRCGPSHGLVLLPSVVRDRRVASGVLGCPNCRERYPIEGAVTDVRVPGGAADRAGEGSTASPAPEPSGSGEAVRVAALLGLAESRGVVVLGGPATAHGPALADLLDGIEVVVLGSRDDAEGSGAGGVSRFRVGETIPLRTGCAVGVALTGSSVALADEGVRVLRPGGRLLLDPASATLRERLTSGQAVTPVLDEGETLVARRVG
jgi:uncharacterized protein YbaR (Trm112 family)